MYLDQLRRLSQIRHIITSTFILRTARYYTLPLMPTPADEIHKPATADGWHGVIPSEQFPAEKGRYHLYIGLFCPFAHRANFIRHLKCLTEFIDISVVKPYPKGDEKGWPGWCFPGSDNEYPGATVDHLFGEDYLHKVYFRADLEYAGRYSVPLLWDKKTATAVCNVNSY
jgi:putative glutathione S-transferase